MEVRHPSDFFSAFLWCAVKTALTFQTHILAGVPVCATRVVVRPRSTPRDVTRKQGSE
jgi:hypothetical protein